MSEELKITDSTIGVCQDDLRTFCTLPYQEMQQYIIDNDSSLFSSDGNYSETTRKLQKCLMRHGNVLSDTCLDAILHGAYLIPSLQQAMEGDIPTNSIEKNKVGKQHTPIVSNQDGGIEIQIIVQPRGQNVVLKPPQATTDSKDVTKHSDFLPFTWILVFPFFCIGLVVSIRRGLTYYRQRQHAARINTSKYLPL